MDWLIQRLETTGSTNDDAKAAAESGAPAGTVIWALRQESGRGRRGRAWSSPEGNLYCSVLLRPETRNYGHFSFVAALAIGDVVCDLLPKAQAELKWPNDVLVNGKKISGLLLEAGQGYLVIGMGLNVAHFPENPLYPATSLAAENAVSPPLETILNALLENLGHWAETLQKSGFEPVREAWLARARKGEMRVRLPDGEIEGRFSDLDSDGNLHLLLPGGTTRKFAAGDVFF
ncbi:MAG: biotin--[acetyl-CoA-carboxylase] ligase [Alphaproteobacteria bacterium]|nr:biotin--[acetyl-CoA-carboxylase] ligase [Alphaproteobacteria bacterium]